MEIIRKKTQFQLFLQTSRDLSSLTKSVDRLLDLFPPEVSNADDYKML